MFTYKNKIKLVINSPLFENDDFIFKNYDYFKIIKYQKYHQISKIR